MACDEVLISPSAEMMIHKSVVNAQGNSAQLEKFANRMIAVDEIMTGAYSKKTGMDNQMVCSLMAAETFFTAEQAEKAGLADKIIDFGDEPRQAIRALACSFVDRAIEQMERDTSALAEREERQRILAQNEQIRKKYF